MHSLVRQKIEDSRAPGFDKDLVYRNSKQICFSPDRSHRHHGNNFARFGEIEKWSGCSEIEDGQMVENSEAKVDSSSDLESVQIGLDKMLLNFTSGVNEYSEDGASGFESVLDGYLRCGEPKEVINRSSERGNEATRLGVCAEVRLDKSKSFLAREAGICSLGKRDFGKFESLENCQYSGASKMSPKVRPLGEIVERDQKKILDSTEADFSASKKRFENSPIKFCLSAGKDLENEMCSSQDLKALFYKSLGQIVLKRIKKDSISKQEDWLKKMRIEKSRSKMRKISMWNVRETNLRMANVEAQIMKKSERLEKSKRVYIDSENESINLGCELVEEETEKRVYEDVQIILQTGGNKAGHEEASRRKRNGNTSPQQSNQSQTKQSLSSMKQTGKSPNSRSGQSWNKTPNKPENLKRKPQKPKTFKISNKSSKNSIDFTKIESVLLGLFLGDESWVNIYETLNRYELQHIWMVVWKTYKVKSNKQDPSIRQLLKLQKKVQFKRQEEIFKRVYKPFLKHYLKIFKRRKIDPRIELGKLLRENKIDLREDYYSNPRRAFFMEKFMELIERGIGLNIDLIMDICEELALPLRKIDKGREPLTETENWRSKDVVKVAAMKKISGGFRYLVSRTTDFRASFEKYIGKTAERGLLASHRKQIRRKLETKISFWEEKYQKLACDDVRFLCSLKLELENNKFKFPWSVATMKGAVDCCLGNLKSPKILKEFEEVRELHYTYRG